MGMKEEEKLVQNWKQKEVLEVESKEKFFKTWGKSLQKENGQVWEVMKVRYESQHSGWQRWLSEGITDENVVFVSTNATHICREHKEDWFKEQN